MTYYNLPERKILLISQKALIIDEDKLLVLHRAGTEQADKPKWGLPGGLLEMHESLEEGLVREVEEETGLTVQMGELFAVWDLWERDFGLKGGRVCDVRVIVLAYVCTKMSETIRLSEEHDGYSWAGERELMKLDFSPDSRVGMDKYLRCNADLPFK